MAIVYGVNPVVEALAARPDAVERIYLAQGARVHDLERIQDLASQAGVRIERVPRERVARLAGGKVHQGVVAEVAEARYVDPLDLVEGRGQQPPLILALDQVQDPIHLGTAIRSTHALGGAGVVIPKDRAAGLTPAAMKVSAGAASHLPVARATNLARTLETYKERGLWIVGADMEGEPCDRVDLTGPLCVVIGSEGKGLRQLTRRHCDRLVAIPMIAGGVGSLSASAAASVLLYEVGRQRRAAAK